MLRILIARAFIANQPVLDVNTNDVEIRGAAPIGSLEDEIRCALAATLTDENAGQIAASLSAAEARTEFGVAVLERWATADPNAAAQWLAGQAQPTDEQLYALAKATARDEATLNRIQAQLPAGPVRDLFLAHAVRMAVLERVLAG